MKRSCTSRDPAFRPLAAAVCAVLMGAYGVWWLACPSVSASGRLSAALSAALFGGVCLRFLDRWLAGWTGSQPSPPAPPDPVSRGEAAKVFFVLLLLPGGIVLFLYVLQLAVTGTTDFRAALDLWTSTDSQHYLAIARDGYLSDASLDRRVQLVFLPGYPLALRAVHLLLPDWLSAGMVLSSASFAGAGTVLYHLARLELDRSGARRVLRYACLMPGAFFFAAPMSESLFYLLSLSCIYLARRRRWLPACLLGGLAAFTRSLGLVLLVPVGYELLTAALTRQPSEKKPAQRWLPFLALLLIPAGFAAYCGICRAVSGNPFQWAIYQREHWHQQPGLFFHTAAYQTEQALVSFREGSRKLFLGLWLPNLLCSFAALAVMLPAVPRLRPAWSAYFIAYYAVAMGATWLLSAPRYLTVLFPVVFGLAALTEDRRRDILLTLLMTVASVLYALLFAARWQVW